MKDEPGTPADWAECERWAEIILAQEGITRRSFESLYNAFLASREPLVRAKLKSNFLHAIASTRPEGEGVSGLNLGNDQVAIALAIFGLGTKEAILRFAQNSLPLQIIAKLLPETSPEEPQSSDQDISELGGALDLKDADPEKFASLLESLATRAGQSVGVQVGAAAWTWSATFLSAVGMANRRVATIRVLGPNTQGEIVELSVGTGLLVGPASILTNWHVVDPAFDVQNELILKSDFSIEIQFDNQTTAKNAPGECLIYHSAVGTDKPSSATSVAGAEWWTQASTFEDWSKENQDALDCAVIRIEPAIGLLRGWYNLAELPKPKGGRCWFVHYPAGIARAVSGGEAPMISASRLLHRCPSAKGSSGGLLLDAAGSPLGLHQRVFGDHVHRAAIPLKTIFTALQGEPEALKRLEEVGVPYVKGSTLEDGTPVLARGDLLRAFGRALDQNASVLFIAPDSNAEERLGRTFCGQVLEAATIPGQHLWRRFTPGELPSDPRSFVQSILKIIGRTKSADLPPQETAENAYALRLAQFICREVSHSAFSLWIVLDDLDRTSIADTSMRVFLGHLYREASLTTKLRFVLIGAQERVLLGLGLKNTALSMPTSSPQPAFEVFQLLPISPTSYPDALSKWMQEKVGPSRAWQADIYDILGRICATSAEGKDPLIQVSRFVRERVSGHL